MCAVVYLLVPDTEHGASCMVGKKALYQLCPQTLGFKFPSWLLDCQDIFGLKSSERLKGE